MNGPKIIPTREAGLETAEAFLPSWQRIRRV